MRPGFPERTGFEDRLRSVERAIRDLQQTAPGGFSGDGKTTFLRGGRSLEVLGGSIKVSEAGSFQIVAADGELLAEFDKDAVTFFDAAGDPIAILDRDGVDIGNGLTILNADGLDIASGLVVIDGLGMTVGTDVEIDTDGLKIDGVLQPAIEPQRRSDQNVSVSLTTTFANILTMAFDPPPWATRAIVWATVSGFITDVSDDSSTLGIRSQEPAAPSTTPTATNTTALMSILVDLVDSCRSQVSSTWCCDGPPG
jgi:hypothetical protein